MVETVLRVWPFTSWILTPLLILLVFISSWATDEQGWDLFVLPFVGLVATPVFALLDLLPRIVVRSSAGVGERAARRVTALMLTHWALLLVLPFVYRGTGDSGSLDSVLQLAFRSAPDELWSVVALVSVVGSALTWLAALVLAFRLPNGRGSAAPDRSMRSRS